MELKTICRRKKFTKICRNISFHLTFEMALDCDHVTHIATE